MINHGSLKKSKFIQKSKYMGYTIDEEYDISEFKYIGSNGFYINTGISVKKMVGTNMNISKERKHPYFKIKISIYNKKNYSMETSLFVLDYVNNQVLYHSTQYSNTIKYGEIKVYFPVRFIKSKIEDSEYLMVTLNDSNRILNDGIVYHNKKENLVVDKGDQFKKLRIIGNIQINHQKTKKEVVYIGKLMMIEEGKAIYPTVVLEVLNGNIIKCQNLEIKNKYKYYVPVKQSNITTIIILANNSIAIGTDDGKILIFQDQLVLRKMNSIKISNFQIISIRESIMNDILYVVDSQCNIYQVNTLNQQAEKLDIANCIKVNSIYDLKTLVFDILRIEFSKSDILVLNEDNETLWISQYCHKKEGFLSKPILIHLKHHVNDVWRDDMRVKQMKIISSKETETLVIFILMESTKKYENHSKQELLMMSYCLKTNLISRVTKILTRVKDQNSNIFKDYTTGLILSFEIIQSNNTMKDTVIIVLQGSKHLIYYDVQNDKTKEIHQIFKKNSSQYIKQYINNNINYEINKDKPHPPKEIKTYFIDNLGNLITF